ncbi:ribosomal RNA small subunit methyltransferase A [Methanobrevibacter cuticularis]|uniref:Probable ribosomal RNA small subunit methyltransferase A n=1 Tax=Methanobrevibacter cuticularis TaxID=47311 RepID=A0A166DT43_9EURY|nr:16S rRNA (adenine(1518)-N(6)/adenine(1519)-N(6))-dimethyltransferase RsmA [Methanobrevibacter cuticularis]KZX15924.1 ribosomal RNA small subunit methyltransferase A [Methanobrevibacter cuticularis]
MKFVTNSYSLAKETKEILQENGIHLNKKLGQNYLIDDFKRKKIISFGELNKDDIVLEIGPGIGTLTIELAKKAKKVIAIEQDLNIFNILKKRLDNENIQNVELIHGDAVKIDFPKFNKIISNLPYQISSPITFKFLEYDFDLAILMYQKEFARRMKVKLNTKDYSRLSAMLYFKGNFEFLDDVSPESFIPKPKIDSTVIKLTPKNIPIDLDIINNQYKKICKALFQHKNKKIRNALIDSRHEIGYSDKKELKSLLNNLVKVEPDLEAFLSRRTITMAPKEILSLTKILKAIVR